MAVLHVELFGRPRFTDDDRGVDLKLTRTIQALLAYLLVERNRAHSREVLASVFWSDNRQERAQASLNTALWRLRCAIESHSPPDCPFLLLNQQGEIAFNLNSSYWLDVEAFEDLSSRVPGPPEPTISPGSIQKVEQAVQLYRGCLLEGFFEDWVLRERERLRSRYLACLAYLQFAHQKLGNYEASLVFGRRILAEEPLSEETHRALMRLYVRMGQRALAIRQYETCRDILLSELGISPMPETEQLYQQIANSVGLEQTRNQAAQAPTPPQTDLPLNRWSEPGLRALEISANDLPPAEADSLRHALRNLREALTLSEAAQHQIQQSIQRVEKLLKKSSHPG